MNVSKMKFNMVPVTKSEMLQRKGRVVRKQPGIFYTLFTESTFNSMLLDTTPEIYTSDITEYLFLRRNYNSADDDVLEEYKNSKSGDGCYY
jgi:HrpA-like RNA helicase